MSLVIMLGACSSHDSQGPESEGSAKWASESRIESIDIGGQYVEGRDIPPAFQGYSKTEAKCLTGNVSTREDMERSLEKNLGADCEIEVYNATARTVEGSGRCEQMGDPSWDYRPQFNFEGSRTDSEGQISFSLEGGANDVSTGQRTWIKILVKTDLKRGDSC